MTKEQIQTLTDVFMRCCTHADWPILCVQDTPYSVTAVEKLLDLYGVKYRKKAPKTIEFLNFYLEGSTNLPYKEIPLVIDEENVSENWLEVRKIVWSLESRLKVVTNLVAARYQEFQQNKKTIMEKSKKEILKTQNNPRLNTMDSERK